MASKLKAKDPKLAEPKKPKIVVFGRAGVGKTYTALDFPVAYYIDSEGGATRDHYTDKLEASGGGYLGQEDGSLDPGVVLDQIAALATEKHQYKTIIIDSLSKIYNRISAQASDKLGDDDVFGASKKPAIKWIRSLLNWLDRVDMNVVLIAHEAEEWGGTGKKREKIGDTFDAWNKLAFELDLILQVVKQGNSRIAYPRKSRLLGFPESEGFPWTYEEFAERYGKDIIERETKPIILATEDQLTRLNEILNVVRIPDSEIEKWFTAAKVESWSEMDTERVEKAIVYLKGKVK